MSAAAPWITCGTGVLGSGRSRGPWLERVALGGTEPGRASSQATHLWHRPRGPHYKGRVAPTGVFHRARGALRLPRGAPRGPEVHERLVEVVRPPARHEDLGEVPERPLAADAREPPRAEEDAAKNAADVGVQHGGVPSVGERKNRARGVPADPRQASERRRVVGQTSAVTRDGLARDRVQAHGTDVVAERVPEPPDLGHARAGEAPERRVAPEELAVL